MYIDGHAGTTGLRIRTWLSGRPDIELFSLPESERKDPARRREALGAADVAILCLPDPAAREAAAWAAETDTRVIDASTAHRVAPEWVYGLPELEPAQRGRIRTARCVANPGCYPTGTILLLRPLIEAGALAPSTPVEIHALSGYSGGGRSLIERWEDPSSPLAALPFPAPYALGRRHKHVAEMMRYAGLQCEPVFLPSVGAFDCGMRVEIPIHAALLGTGWSAQRVAELLADRYRHEPFVDVRVVADPERLTELDLDPRRCNGTNRIELWAIPHPSGHIVLAAILDNLGKGAAGAAIQNLNLMLGYDERTGLTEPVRLARAGGDPE